MLPRKKRSRQKLLQQHTSRMLKASDTTPTNISSLSCPHTSSQFNLTDRRPVKLTSFKMKTSQKPDTLSCLVTQVVYRPSQFCLHGKVSKCSITLSWSTKTPLWKKVGAVLIENNSSYTYTYQRLKDRHHLWIIMRGQYAQPSTQYPREVTWLLCGWLGNSAPLVTVACHLIHENFKNSVKKLIYN